MNNLKLRFYLFLRHFFTAENKKKKRIVLICFIEITSILAQKCQAVKPYSVDVVKRSASNFLLWDFKRNSLARSRLRICTAIWAESLLTSIYWLSTLSSHFLKCSPMNVNKTELPATKGFTTVQCRLWNMDHVLCIMHHVSREQP